MSAQFLRLALSRHIYRYANYAGLHSTVRQVDPKLVATSGTMSDVKISLTKKLGFSMGYSPVVASRDHLAKYEPRTPEKLPPRSMKDSFTSALIPLSNCAQLQDKYVNVFGNVRYGRLMEDMDIFAVWVVSKHLQITDHPVDVPLPYTMVTILVDKVDFTDYLPRFDGDIRLSGQVTWVGKSSVEVIVWVEQEEKGLWHTLTSALFVIGARNCTNNKALMVNPLIPDGDEEQRMFLEAQKRKERRVKDQQESLLRVEPTESEQKLIHNMFIQTVELKDFTFKKRKLPEDAVWMSDTTLSNVILSHPEDRNVQNTIFGGFLMRHALELSYMVAYRFCKKRPMLQRISDITFHRPVFVSSCITMTSKVIFTETNYLQIVVIAEASDPANSKAYTTNVFYYTYWLPDNVVPKVTPKTYSQAMWYIDGRRKFKYAMSHLSMT